MRHVHHDMYILYFFVANIVFQTNILEGFFFLWNNFAKTGASCMVKKKRSNILFFSVVRSVRARSARDVAISSDHVVVIFWRKSGAVLLATAKSCRIFWSRVPSACVLFCCFLHNDLFLCLTITAWHDEVVVFSFYFVLLVLFFIITISATRRDAA